MLLLAATAAFAQQSPGKTQVKINYLNVCTPSEADQRELAAALDRLPQHPKFSEDFEVARGRTTASESALKIEGLQDSAAPQHGPSRWVRVRRELSADSPFLSTQYSLSVDEKNVDETLVFHSREMKDVIETALEDRAASVTDPLAMLNTETPADRIRLERFGKPSIVLARCPGAAQDAYEPLFAKASSILSHYRTLLGVRQTVPADLKRLGVGAPPKNPPAKTSTMKKK